MNFPLFQVKFPNDSCHLKATKRRRAVCVLGCPAGLTSQQEAALASAARSAGWQVWRGGTETVWRVEDGESSQRLFITTVIVIIINTMHIYIIIYIYKFSPIIGKTIIRIQNSI